MVITQTPFRISFFGGGTDYPGFYENYGGSVISTTFDKYCYATVRHLPRFFDYANQITYNVIERTNHVDEIEHPAVREIMKYLDMHELRVVYEADLPARSGLGTSSSFAVGLLNACYALKGKYVDKRHLADDAIYVERVLCKESGGIQDQIAASFGGFNRIDFDAGGYHVNPLVISEERKKQLNHNLMLFFTGFSRFSSDIALSQEKAIKGRTAQLMEMKGLVDEAEKILTSKVDLREFGNLLDYTWHLKREITSSISSDSIDLLYRRALKAGAIGGKLLGAGGGGFLLFYVEREKQAAVLEELSHLLYVPFEFETGGTRIMYYKSEDFDLKGIKKSYA
ncbi:MAG: kinase [Lachnospiraceae bacterium]|nr:kinase [Lachnospiraceae bacterium]